MSSLLKKLIIGTPLESVARAILKKPKVAFENSPQYWDERYQQNGTSGSGSYGRLAAFKAEFLNAFVAKNAVQTVIEFGCGDGNQLSSATYPDYVGVDVSRTAVEKCAARFAGTPGRRFVHLPDYVVAPHDLAMSLDVIYHLVEDEIYARYMETLFKSSSRFVIVYSSDYDEATSASGHVRHRKFSDWVAKNAPEFALIETIPNRFPFDAQDPDNTSLADFFLYALKA